MDSPLFSLILPAPVFGLMFGREWFVEPGVTTTTVVSDADAISTSICPTPTVSIRITCDP